MRRWLVLATTHLAVLALGFGAGIYALPILTAPGAPDAKALDRVAAETLYAGRFVRDLKGSNRLHWGEGEVRVSRNHIAHFGRLAPGPDYKLYLAPRFVDTGGSFPPGQRRIAPRRRREDVQGLPRGCADRHRCSRLHHGRYLVRIIRSVHQRR